MAINKITNAERELVSVYGLPDKPGMSTEAIQQRFDGLGNLAIDKVNEVIEVTNQSSADIKDLDTRVDQIANNQIPEEYVKDKVDEYIAENQSGLATKEELEANTNQLSSEIGDLKSDLYKIEDVELLEFQNMIVDTVNNRFVTYNGYTSYCIKLEPNSKYIIKTTNGVSYGYSNTRSYGDTITLENCSVVTTNTTILKTTDSNYDYLYLWTSDNQIEITRCVENETRNVEEIKLSNIKFFHGVYSDDGVCNTSNESYLSNENLLYVGKGNAFKVFVKNGWEVNPNYHDKYFSDTRTYYEPLYSKTETFYAKDDYVRLIFIKRDESGSTINLTNVESPEARLFIVNNGVIDPIDFGAKYDGITDCTHAFQTCLDYGILKIDSVGMALCKTLEINQSGTVIDLHPKFTIKLADGTNDPLICTIGSHNSNDSVNEETTISNITIKGGIWYGNGNNQSKSPGSYITKNHSEIHWWSMILLLDVDDLKIKDITMKDPFRFGMMIGNVHRFTIKDVFCDYYDRPLPNGWSMDGIHFGGEAIDGLIDHVYGVTNDDMVAINVEGDYDSVKEDMPRRGNAKRIIIKNIVADGGYRAVRLLCGTEFTCDDILIDGVYGTYSFKSAIHISNWGEDAHHKNVTVRNINAKVPECVVQIGEDVSWRQQYTEIDNLVVDNVTIEPRENETNMLLKSYNGGTVHNLTLNNLFVNESNVLETPLINGKVNYAMVSNMNIKPAITVFSDVDNVLVSNAFLNGSTLYGNAPKNHSESNVIN